MLARLARATTRGGVRGKVESDRVRGNCLSRPFLFGAALAARSRGFVYATKKRGFWWLRGGQCASGAAGPRGAWDLGTAPKKRGFWWLRGGWCASGAAGPRGAGVLVTAPKSVVFGGCV